MSVHSDYMVRQIRQLIEALVALLRGDRGDRAAMDERGIEGDVGLSLDLATRLGVPSILELLGAPDHLDHRRCAVVGLALGGRSVVAEQRGDAAHALRLRHMALELLDAAEEGLPGEDFERVRERLRR